MSRRHRSSEKRPAPRSAHRNVPAPQRRLCSRHVGRQGSRRSAAYLQARSASTFPLRPWTCTFHCRTKCPSRSEEHTSELQSRRELVCRLLLEKKKYRYKDASCDCIYETDTNCTYGSQYHVLPYADTKALYLDVLCLGAVYGTFFF